MFLNIMFDKNVTIKDGIINIPYNFNNEKYIVGIEDKETNEIKVSKTIIPIKEAKPSYSLVITPKQYDISGSTVSPCFHTKKNVDGEYEMVNSEVIYTVKFIVDDIQIPVSDYIIKTDWDKYNITNSIEPFEIKVSINDSTTAIKSGSTQYTILENSGSFDEEVNIFIDYNDIMFTTTLKTTFQKSYFETISLYDSIDIMPRTDKTSKKRNVITIDGFYNDNKVNKDNLIVNFDLDSNDNFTTLASTMGYIDIVKGENEWFLEHEEMGKDYYTGNTPLHGYIVDKNHNIIEDGKIIVNGISLYNNNNKIIDSYGAIYDGNTKLIDNSGNTNFTNNIIIDNSGNTLYKTSNNTKKIIDNKSKNINTISGDFIVNLNENKIYSTFNSGCTVDITNNTVYSGTSDNIILDRNSFIPLKFGNNTYRYDFNNKKLYSGGTQNTGLTIYDNNNNKLNISGNTNHNIIPSTNTYLVSGNTIIDEYGDVKGISGFGYNIKSGVISDNSGKTLVTVTTSDNNFLFNTRPTGCTFNSGYTTTNYGYYINDIDGNIKYSSTFSPLLSGQTVYSSTGETAEDKIIVKNTNTGGVRYNGITCPIKFGFDTSNIITGATGYTDYTGTKETFKIDENNTLYTIKIVQYIGANINEGIPFVETNNSVSFNLSASNSYEISEITVSGNVIETGTTVNDSVVTLKLSGITSDITITVKTNRIYANGKKVPSTSKITLSSNTYTNTESYHKRFKNNSEIIMCCGTTKICTFNKLRKRITDCNFTAPGGSITTANTISFVLNSKLNFIQSGSFSFDIYDESEKNKIITISSSLQPNYIKLADKYYYYKYSQTIYYNTSNISGSSISAKITDLTIGNSNNTNSKTYITNGLITYNGKGLLNLSNGTTNFSSNLTYYYKNKNLNYNTSNTIINFSNNKLNYTTGGTSGIKVLDLDNNNIINNSENILVSNKKEISGNTGFIYYMVNKQVKYSGLTYNLNTSDSVTITGDTTSGYVITYDKNTGTTLNNKSNNIIISGNKIKLDLNKDYTLTATTGYVKDVDDVNKTILTAITTNIGNKHFTWDVESKSIKDGNQILTNINDDRPFYYCNTSGEILYNKEKVKYVIDDEGEYWDISNGNKILIKDTDKSGESLIIKPTNVKVVPPKKKIEDKYGNIKINKKNSFNKKTGTYRDVDNKIITGVTSGASQYPLDESYYTTIVDLTSGYIYDANGRTLMNSNGKTVYIEGGLVLTRLGDGTDAILSERGAVLVSGITDNSIGGLTNQANNYGVTKEGNTYYYRNKKLYDSNGAYYFEKLITETTNSGFTLQNGVIIKPAPNQKNKAATGGYGDRADYSHGVIIEFNDFFVTITQDDGDQGGGGGYCLSESGGTKNPGFTIVDDGLLYLGAKIANFKYGKIYDIYSLLDLNYKIDFTKIPDTTLTYTDLGDVDLVVDETGKNDVYEIEEKETVYYDSHYIKNIKTYIPDLISYFFKSNKEKGYKLNVETTYMGVMKDKKDYLIVDGGKNHSSYKIKVEPQFITQNMIKNGTTVKAYVVNNHGDHIHYSTYSGNGYTFKYTTDTNSDFNIVKDDTFIYTLSTETPIFNEIKFNLECEGSLINQEIIEVLGENKFITSTEYINNTDSGVTFKITETTNTYYNTDIIWGIENGLSNVSFNANTNTLTISKGVSGTVILSGACNNIKVYEKTIVITKNGEKGEPGQPGETGPQGPRGKLLYPAGRWNSGTTYNGADTGKIPFVTYKVGDEDKYFVLTATTKISGTTYEPNKSGWTEMEQYEAIYTKLLVAENGLVGGSVYNGDYVFSKDGTVNNTTSNEYNKFPNSGLQLVDLIFSGDSEYRYYDTFIPNYLVDFNKGRAWFGGGKTIINENGTLISNDIVNIFDGYALPIPDKNGLYGEGVKWDGEDIHISKDVNNQLNGCYLKIVNTFNSFIYDDYQQCVLTPQILGLILSDDLITRQDIWYRGEMYLIKNCSEKIFDITHYENGNKGKHNYYIIKNNGCTKVEFMFKWDGKESEKQYYDNSGSHAPVKTVSYKTGQLILLTNLQTFENWKDYNSYPTQTSIVLSDLIDN